MESSRSRSEEKGMPLSRELILSRPSESWSVIFPNGRLFLIKKSRGLHLSEINPDSGQLLREEKLSDQYLEISSVTAFVHPVTTFKNKIVLARQDYYHFSSLTLIIDVDTFRIEQQLAFIIESITELGDKNQCVVKRDNTFGDNQAYIADPATLGTVIADVTPPSECVQSVCVLSDNELAVLTTPHYLYLEDSCLGRITIFEEKKPDEWIAQRSAPIEVSGRTTLKKLNETQIIQISNIRKKTEALDPLYTNQHHKENYITYSLFSIIDKHGPTCHRIASLRTGPNQLPKVDLFDFNTFLMNSGDDFFSLEITSQGLRAKRFDFQFIRPDEHYTAEYTVLENGRTIVFRYMPDYSNFSEFDHRDRFIHFNFFALAPRRLSKDSIVIQSILSPAVLPSVLTKIISDYCAGDFPLFIERNDSLIPGTASSATPSRAPEEKGAPRTMSTRFASKQGQEAAPPQAAESVPPATTTTPIPSLIADTVSSNERAEDVISLPLLKKQIRFVLNRLIHEINFLRSKRDKSCFAFFINFELSTKSRKRAALESLMAASSFKELYDQAETLLRDRSTRIHRAGTNTVTSSKGISRTTELLLRIVSGPFGTTERRPSQNDFGRRV